MSLASYTLHIPCAMSLASHTLHIQALDLKRVKSFALLIGKLQTFLWEIRGRRPMFNENFIEGGII